MRDVLGTPALEDQAFSDDWPEVREGLPLWGVSGLEHESADGEAEVQPASGRGGGEEVRVDLRLCVVVVGEPGVEQ